MDINVTWFSSFDQDNSEDFYVENTKYNLLAREINFLISPQKPDFHSNNLMCYNLAIFCTRGLEISFNKLF